MNPTELQGIIDNASASFQGGGLLSGWQGNLGIALFTSVMILTFIYIMGVLLRNQNAINFVKFELYELLISAILVGILISAISVMNSLTVGYLFSYAPKANLLTNPDEKLYQATDDYYEKVGTEIIGWMHTDYLFGIWLDNLASATPYSRPLGVGLVAAPLAGFATPLKQILYNINSALAIGFIVNIAQKIIYEFTVVSFLRFYLPMAIVLRCFTPTRRLGGSLIAIALGFLFIFPILTAIDNQIINQPVENTRAAIKNIIETNFVSTDNNGNPALKTGSKKTIVGEFTDFLYNYSIGLVANIGSFFQNVFGSMFAVAFLVPLSTVGIAFAVAYLLPAINVLVLVQSIRFMSRALGEEVDITTLTRMV